MSPHLPQKYNTFPHLRIYCNAEVIFLDYAELTSLITALANVIARNTSEEQLEILAVVFTQLGDTLTTILTLKQR